MKRGALVAFILSASIVAPPSPAQAATATKAIRYGPFTIPAASDTSPGKIDNKLKFAVPRPCVACFITSMKPNLVYEDGSTANIHHGVMLHHFVLTSQFQRDATCGNEPLGLVGERFFASGNERTVAKFPSGYGYRVRWYDSWNLLVDLMNRSPEPKKVYVEVTYTYRPVWESVKKVRPVWLDIDQCRDSQYSIPAGSSDTHWDWRVNVPGRIVTMLGHLHGHGVAIEATNESRGGVSICRSIAMLDPHDPDHVMSMSTCNADPVAVVERDEIIRLHSMYDSPEPANDVMGIMLAYIHGS